MPQHDVLIQSTAGPFTIQFVCCYTRRKRVLYKQCVCVCVCEDTELHKMCAVVILGYDAMQLSNW